MAKFNRIKGALADAGKKNKDLADFMKVTPTTVSDWVRNMNQPSISDLFRIAEFIGCEPADLLNTKAKARG